MDARVGKQVNVVQVELLSEIFVEIIFRRIIVGFFGYYTLLGFFKITGNKNGLDWLTKDAEHEGAEFGRGCIIAFVGGASFLVIFIVCAYVFVELLGF